MDFLASFFACSSALTVFIIESNELNEETLFTAGIALGFNVGIDTLGVASELDIG